jgi:hypothetical protein
MPNKLAVITVHTGALKKLFITLHSVNTQSIKPDIHLIVSKKYVNINNSVNYRKFIFNKDKSLYNAMNIGQSLAANFSFLYLNSGDHFYSKNSISIIKKYNIIYKNKCLIFKTVLKYNNLTFEPKNNFFYSNIFRQHPSFVCPAHKRKNKFDEKYSILSDGIWMKSQCERFGYKKINLKISVLSLGGISSNPKLVSIKEYFSFSLKDGLKELLKFFIKEILSNNNFYKTIFRKNFILK